MVLENSGNGPSYIEFIFHPERRGMLDVVESIVGFMDYQSLISLKRCCKSVHQCLAANPDLEIKKYRQKIARDWSSGSHRDVSMSVSGLVSCADFFAPPHIRKVALGVDDKVHVCTVRGSQGDDDNTNCDIVLPASDSTNNCTDCITCVSVLNGFHDQSDRGGNYAVASGSNDGKLLIWENGDLKVTKQLFGRIEELKWVPDHNFLISAHFGGGGRSHDAGCISIRLVESLDGQPLPVVFSLFQDIFPVFCVDISPRMRVGSGGQPSTNHYLATVEWSGTFNNVHDGLLNVYKGFQSQPLSNVSLESGSTFTCCKFVSEDQLITGGHDKKLRLWKIQDEANTSPEESKVVTCLMQLNGHTNVIMRLQVTSTKAVTRDLDGSIFVWDLEKLTNRAATDGAKNETLSESDTEELLLTKVKSLSKTVTCIAMDDRKLFLGSIGHFDMFDYWTTS